ncbi:MAG TPA: GGDEF domain-containing protein [Candidatus Bilamarchaeum sp.]|nr:GGDEF domain-containing protein [Candidatus Bilamarchaeum sp.]
MTRELKRQILGSASARQLPSLRPPLLEGLAGEAEGKMISLSPLEMALYRLTCTVNARTTPIEDATISLMKELGAEEASIHLKDGRGSGMLEHYVTVQREGGAFEIIPNGSPAGYLASSAFGERSMFFSVPRGGRKKKSTLYKFNMVPGDTTYSYRDIKNGDRQVCAVPLFMAERAESSPELSNKLGVLTLAGRRLSVQEAKGTGAAAVQKAALLVACGARLLSTVVDARFDPLTGLQKRPEFDAQLSRLVGEYLAGGPNFSMLMFDLDHFKRVNDTYGHDAGDRALQDVARTLSSGLRGMRRGDVLERRTAGRQAGLDQCFRWGGEELAVILPRTDIGEALSIAERLRQSIKGRQVDVGNAEVGLTVSVGVSDADSVIGRKDRHDTDIENLAHKLTHEADFALYTAKSGGRDIVAYADGSSEIRRYFIFAQGQRV